eukprot:GEMP01025618.1.p1 GENE.GEMP01025618.1~~GEMP01025618.1.p1  ORF type:complete len:165 (+),score=29.45 GEMP01025618.1:149-643(+)
MGNLVVKSKNMYALASSSPPADKPLFDVEMSQGVTPEPEHIKEIRQCFKKASYEYELKEINGIIYDGGLIQLCELALQGRSGSPIARTDAIHLLNLIRPIYKWRLSQIEKDTFTYIIQQYKWTSQATSTLRSQWHKWSPKDKLAALSAPAPRSAKHVKKSILKK